MLIEAIFIHICISKRYNPNEMDSFATAEIESKSGLFLIRAIY